ncbi:hypothetical protein DPEC_G00319620 [Dallia pectoralis]|uniref:Uncharacterized protein n=1 Tax=Dallia pectoralis TaxID=75939 RepID=A0ACC2F9Y1_DALPE|nr:hypothetical protein DPEC_G00319620 [Dallia pectoralis]
MVAMSKVAERVHQPAGRAAPHLGSLLRGAPELTRTGTWRRGVVCARTTGRLLPVWRRELSENHQRESYLNGQKWRESSWTDNPRSQHWPPKAD